MKNEAYLVQSLQELEQLAQKLLPQIQAFKHVAFEGEIGAGKTTFIKILCKLLGVKGATSSPTFSIINEYAATHTSVYHVDLYRLDSTDDVLNIGLTELFDDKNYCFIEWPDLALSLFPDKMLWIKIQLTEQQHRLFQVGQL